VKTGYLENYCSGWLGLSLRPFALNPDPIHRPVTAHTSRGFSRQLRKDKATKSGKTFKPLSPALTAQGESATRLRAYLAWNEAKIIPGPA